MLKSLKYSVVVKIQLTYGIKIVLLLVSLLCPNTHVSPFLQMN